MMIFGICVGPSDKFERFCRPALTGIMAPDDMIILRRDQTSIFAAYNSIANEAMGYPAIEGLILLHDDVELRERPDLTRYFDDGVAVVGVIGGRDNDGIAWWHAPETFGRALDLEGVSQGTSGTHAVDVIDGLLMALSPWAVRHLRWDARRYRGFHGYEADICEKAKASDHLVLVTDIAHIHHGHRGYGGGWNDWKRNELRWQRKWRKPTLAQRCWTYLMEVRLAVARITKR